MRRSMRLLSMAARAMVSICVEGQPAPAQRPWFCFCNDGSTMASRRTSSRGRVEPWTCIPRIVRQLSASVVRALGHAQQSALACSGVNVWCPSQPVPTIR